MDALNPEFGIDAEGRGGASIETERTAGDRFFLDPQELAVEEEANRPRTGEEFLAHAAHEPS